MRILVTGGGTGGHIYPAIAVAREIRRRNSEARFLFIGTKRGVESKAVPAADFRISYVSAAGMSKNPVKLAKFFLFNAWGFLQAFAKIMEFSPDVVIGSGGFVSAPVLFASRVLGVPYVLLEQNVLPGKVNRLMAKGAKRVLASFEASKKYLPEKNTVITGNPIRREIIEADREESVKKLNLNPDMPFILITGASQGARSINSAILKSLERWKDRGWQILHLVGRKNYEEVKAESDKVLKKIDFKGEYRCIDYSEDIASLYAVSDLCVARSGASTLAEVTVRGLPCILIPYPYAADNHQEKNARSVEEAGGAVVIIDKDAEEKLAPEVERLMDDEKERKEMSENIKTLGRPEALDEIVKQISDVIGLPI